MRKHAQPETQEQILRRREKEKKELARWEKEAAKSKSSHYVAYLLMILALVQCIDGISTQINVQMQSEIAIGLFQDRLSIMQLTSILTLPIMLGTVFYKALADRYGRKLFLVINTLGMAAGLFLVYLAGAMGKLPGIVMYLLGAAVINFFIANDTQVLFIMETADPDKRATTFSVINAIGTLSVVLIPLMRKAFMGDDITRWNLVYIVPGIVALVICLLCLLSARESDVFLENRISYLRKTDEERIAEAEEAREKNEEMKSQGGIGAAFRYALKHPQHRWLFLAVLAYGLSAFGMNYYEKIADIYYTTSQVTTALFWFPFGAAATTVSAGLVSDRFGRKKGATSMAFVCLAGFSLFFAGCNFGWSPILAGLMIGIYCGGSWGITDTMTIMIGELSPTNMRASLMSAGSLVNFVSKMLAAIIPVIVLLISHDNYAVLGWMCIFGAIPLMAISLLTLAFKVHDTKGANLYEAGSDQG